jgi:hypothetical protein
MAKKNVDKTNLTKKVVMPKSRKSTVTKEIIKWLKQVGWEEKPEERVDGKGSFTNFIFLIQNDKKLNCMIISDEDENEMLSLVASPEFIIPKNKVADVTDFCFHFRKDHGNLYITDKGEINYINSRSIDSFNNGLDDVGIEIQNMIDEMDDYLRYLISPIEDIANATTNLEKALKSLRRNKFFHEETKSIEEEVAALKTELSDQDFQVDDKSSAATADIIIKNRIKKSSSNVDEVATKQQGIKMPKKSTNKMLELIEKFTDEVGLEKRIEVDDNGDVTFNATFNMEIDGYEEELPFTFHIIGAPDLSFILGYLYIDSDDFIIPKNKVAKALEVVNELNQDCVYGRFAVVNGNKHYQFLKPFILGQLGISTCTTEIINTILIDCRVAYQNNFKKLTEFF